VVDVEDEAVPVDVALVKGLLELDRTLGAYTDGVV